jgi:hypothetical protein
MTTRIYTVNDKNQTRYIGTYDTQTEIDRIINGRTVVKVAQDNRSRFTRKLYLKEGK